MQISPLTMAAVDLPGDNDDESFPSADIGLRLREWTSDIEAFVELAGGVLERHSGFCN